MENILTIANNRESTGEEADEATHNQPHDNTENNNPNGNSRQNAHYYQNSSPYFSNKNYSRRHEENYPGSNYHSTKEFNNYSQTGHTHQGSYHKYYNYPYNNHQSNIYSHNTHSHPHRNSISYHKQHKKNSINAQNSSSINPAHNTNSVYIMPNANGPSTKYETFKKKKRSLKSQINSNMHHNIYAGPSVQSNSNNIPNNNPYLQQYAQQYTQQYNQQYPHAHTNNNTMTYNNFNNLHLHLKSKSSSAIKKLIFINSYDKCSDFSNYKGFLNLNLKFLKQNYKFKENDQEENNMMMNNLHNLNHLNFILNQNNTNNINAQNYMYMMLQMNKNNKGANFQQYTQQTPPNISQSNLHTESNPNNLSDTEILQGTYFYNAYLGVNKNASETGNPNVNANANPSNYLSNDENNNLYYESLKLQPYTFVKDTKIIEDNLNTGRYLKGVIRINKCHTHGYITVEGLENDILIRGNRNLNQSLHMDEVIVELFPMVCWKPLFNKKVRKLSLAQRSTDGIERNIGNANLISGKDSTENVVQANYYTDIEKDNEDLDLPEGKEEIDIPVEDTKKENSENIVGPNNEDDDINAMKYKENFETLEERLRYINKVYNLRPEGRIVKIVHSPNYEKAHIVRITNEKTLIFACPIDENLPKIFIKMKKFRRVEFIKKLENDSNFRNKYFLVRIVGWALNFKCPKGIIVNELGNSGDIEVETEVLLRTYEIDYTAEYPQQATEEMKQLESFTVESETDKRVDLRNEIIFTIDPKHSKDLDDAISVKVIDEESGLLEIGVHIADPSHFVTKDSLMDKEAMARTTTVYLVHKNIPMLPRFLSENLCSLLPYQDRLAFSCVFRIYLNGALDTNFKPHFFLSIMNSSAKWNYELAQRIINEEEVKYEDLSFEDGTKPKSEEIFNRMCEKVRILHKLTKLVRSQRIESGSLIIENEEVAFDLDDKTKSPIGFKIKHKGDSNHMIEELMLIANKLTAEYLYENLKDHALIRKHPFLNDNKFSEIQRYLSQNKLVVDFEDAQALNDMLSKIKNQNFNKYICIQRKLKNFMQRAEYVVSGYEDYQDLRHSALNFDLYTHFTSPIRRYPDLIVHRQLKYVISQMKSPSEASGDDYSGYDRFVDQFNEKYVNGKQISTKCQKVFHCILLKNIPSKIYKALVVDINYKANNKIKRPNLPMNNPMSETAPSLTVTIFIPELNIEIDWKKEDNPNILNFRVSNDNSLTIDYLVEDGTLHNKTIKTFEEVFVTVSCVDSIPIDLKCSLDLNEKHLNSCKN